MPIDEGTVRTVTKSETSVPGLWSYCVSLQSFPLRPGAVPLLASYETVNATDARICEGAQLFQQPVKITWKRTTYGRTILSVKLSQQQEIA